MKLSDDVCGVLIQSDVGTPMKARKEPTDKSLFQILHCRYKRSPFT